MQKIWPSPSYTREQNPGLGLCNLSEENEQLITNDLRKKKKENTVLCRNRIFSDVIAFPASVSYSGWVIRL